MDWYQGLHKYSDENSVWKVGSGDKINVWKDNWCGQSLVSLLQIPEYRHNNLKSTLSDIIQNKCIILPSLLVSLHSNLSQLVAEVCPNVLQADKLKWNLNDIGQLSTKDAFIHMKGHSQVSN
ncbi:unnamed protein product [Vicia faba]|uniref:Uncharacterized protein n=1 Tax=Vicia faba TaxID=3906 RepID=A0AAV1BCA6_VICFA|nr:unnamed protein product [Vicia faba]